MNETRIETTKIGNLEISITANDDNVFSIEYHLDDFTLKIDKEEPTRPERKP